MSGAAEESLRGPTCVRRNSSRANVDAMAVRNVRNAAVVVRSSNDRRNSSGHRSSKRRHRKPRESGREGVAGVVAAAIAAKSRLRTLPRRNSNSNRVLRASRVLLGRRKPRVRMPRERQLRVRKVMVRKSVAVFGGVEAAVVAGRKALRRRLR